MAESQPTLSIEVASNIGAIDPVAWDALVPADDPFCTHAFLSAVEDSGSACADTGWVPAHVVVRAAEPSGIDRIVAAPAYVKDHSYGEYIFDWGWAQPASGQGFRTIQRSWPRCRLRLPRADGFWWLRMGRWRLMSWNRRFLKVCAT